MASSSTPLTSNPSPPPSLVQRDWDDQCCKAQTESLLNAAKDHVTRARLLVACFPGSGACMARCTAAVQHRTEDEQCNGSIIAAGLRLGAPVVRPYVCVCRAVVITVSLVLVVLVVIAATTRSLIYFAVLSSVRSRLQLGHLTCCTPQLGSDQMASTVTAEARTLSCMGRNLSRYLRTVSYP